MGGTQRRGREMEQELLVKLTLKFQLQEHMNAFIV